ncbi:MAG TPA: HNH endonuclease [Candidatus Tectomicrobia bacterium]
MSFKDPERQRAIVKAWKDAHPEAMRKYRATYRGKFPVKNQQARNRRKRERLLTDEVFRAKRIAALHDYFARHPEVRHINQTRRRARLLGAAVNDLTAAQWEEIKVAYDHRCVYCGRKMQRLTQDHITPLSKGGMHTASNIVPACRSCNSRKFVGDVLVPVQPLLLTVAPAKEVKQQKHLKDDAA